MLESLENTGLKGELCGVILINEKREVIKEVIKNALKPSIYATFKH